MAKSEGNAREALFGTTGTELRKQIMDFGVELSVEQTSKVSETVTTNVANSVINVFATDMARQILSTTLTQRDEVAKGGALYYRLAGMTEVLEVLAEYQKLINTGECICGQCGTDQATPEK